MQVKFYFKDLNSDPRSPYLINTYNYRVIITLRECDDRVVN